MLGGGEPVLICTYLLSSVITFIFQMSEKKGVEFELLSGKLAKDVDRLEKEIEDKQEEMITIQDTMEQTLELFANMA